MAKVTDLRGIAWMEASLRDLEKPVQPAPAARFDLYRFPWIQPLLRSRWPQFLARALALSGFIFTIAAGLFGPRAGSHNFAIIMVWIAWWSALKLAFIPLGGRSWCSICPIPLPGEWLKQGGFLQKGRRGFGLNLRWPKGLKGSWLQSGGFLLIGMFSAVTLTDGRITAWVLLGLFGLATALGLVFERRAFCTQLCPIGGFSSIYAKTAPLEVRVIDRAICASHHEKSCYQNCPWGIYPVALRDSSQCGLCMECLRTCPSGNIAFNLRPFGTDLAPERGNQPGRLDNTVLALVMMGSALAFAAVFSGPWGALKTAAFTIGSPAWFGYSIAFLALNLVALPGCFVLVVWIGQRFPGNWRLLRRAVAEQAQVLLPLGLFAWIAFTVSFALPKTGYITGVLQDPFGWGWNPSGTGSPFPPTIVPGFSPLLQAGLLLAGLFWSARVARRLADTDNQADLLRVCPILGFCLAFSLVMLWLLVG